MAITVTIQRATAGFGSECNYEDYLINSFASISDETGAKFIAHDTTTSDNSFGSNIDLIFNGVGFTYDNTGAIVGGTITSVDILPVSLGAIASVIDHSYGNAASLYNAWANRGTDGGAALHDLMWGASFSYTGNDGNDLFRGGDLHDVIRGGLGDDTLDGRAGNDTIDGGGGADHMSGGTGNDKFFVDNANDQVSEASGQGTDAVYAGVDYTLQAGQEIEYLRANNNSGLALTGNELVNRIYGGNGDDTLDGGGGADSLYGGAGDDTYIVNNTGVHVIENDGVVDLGGGFDTVQASITYSLPNYIEDLTLTGTDSINGYGNGLDNTIVGNSGVNVLKGYDGDDTLDGGGGNDTLAGGNDNDTYIINNLGVRISEAADAGFDTVQSSISFNLTSNLEALQLTGSADLNGGGNTLDNVITGNGGQNTLSGGDGNDVLNGNAGNDVLHGGNGADVLSGGAGKDVLYGDAGADAFVFAAALNATTNMDTIRDFVSGTDAMHLDQSIFTALTDGVLPDSAFWTITTGTSVSAHDADDRIIYNSATGVLAYDADGSGSVAAPVKFAALTAADGSHPAITHNDFLVVV